MKIKPFAVTELFINVINDITNIVVFEKIRRNLFWLFMFYIYLVLDTAIGMLMTAGAEKLGYAPIIVAFIWVSDAFVMPLRAAVVAKRKQLMMDKQE